MAHIPTYARDAGRLVQFALQPTARPAQDAEYRVLVDRYIDDLEFRSVVRDVAGGLGLWVMDAGDHGMVVAPTPDSVFSPSSDVYRVSGGTSFQDRVIDGLVQVGIIAAFFPRAEDLEDDAAAPELSVAQIADVLRQIVHRLAEQDEETPDPEVDPTGAVMEEAWRLYRDLPDVHETPGGRIARRSAFAKIESALEFLRSRGHMMKETRQGEAKYRPTWRYSVHVREFACTDIYERVKAVLDQERRTREEGQQDALTAREVV
jgi:hypothetical protein